MKTNKSRLWILRISPKKVANLFVQLFYRAIGKVIGKRKAVRIMERDWDHLIILDACRHDLFKEVVDKKAESVISGGSMTEEWLQYNFNGEFKDVIYISANPYPSSLNLEKTFGKNPFFKVIDVWNFGWDDKLKTVHPKEVNVALKKMIKKYPKKRFLIHYNQPHHTFIASGKKFIDLEKNEGVDGIQKELSSGILHKVKSMIVKEYGVRTVWKELEEGKISKEECWNAYSDNLKLVMKYVKVLIKDLNGKVIVSADHGNMFGEKGLFAHPRGLRVKELVTVPWYEIKNTRKGGK